MPIKILMTGVNSTVTQSIIKAFNATQHDIRFYGCDINPYSPGLYRVHHAFLVKPYLDPEYESQMLGILKEQEIDVMIPGVEGELQFLASRKEHWEAETACRILVNPQRVVDITQDKYRTVRFLADHGCRYPESCIVVDEEHLREFAERVGFPMIVKPRRGACSRHVYQVKTMEELLSAVKVVPNPVIQEYLSDGSDEEFTCGVFVDVHGHLKGIATIKRTLANGITHTAIVDHFPDVEAEVRRLVEALKPQGSCNIQMRRDRQGRPTTFEINARFSSSVAIRAHFGFNEPDAALRSFYLGEEVPEMLCHPGIALRYVNEVYLDSAEVAALLSQGHHVPHSSVEEHF